MKKDLTEYKDGFFTKIKRFFSNLILQKNEKLKSDININNGTSEYRNRIKVNKNEELQALLKLQREYKAGKITEEDMTDDEHEKLIELYKKQNEELKQKILIKQNKINTLLNQSNG